MWNVNVTGGGINSSLCLLQFVFFHHGHQRWLSLKGGSNSIKSLPPGLVVISVVNHGIISKSKSNKRNMSKQIRRHFFHLLQLITVCQVSLGFVHILLLLAVLFGSGRRQHVLPRHGGLVPRWVGPIRPEMTLNDVIEIFQQRNILFLNHFKSAK